MWCFVYFAGEGRFCAEVVLPAGAGTEYQHVGVLTV